MIQLGSPILKNTIPRKKYQNFLQGEALTVSFDIIVNYLSDSKYDFSMRAHNLRAYKINFTNVRPEVLLHSAHTGINDFINYQQYNGNRNKKHSMYGKQRLFQRSYRTRRNSYNNDCRHGVLQPEPDSAFIWIRIINTCEPCPCRRNDRHLQQHSGSNSRVSRSDRIQISISG